MKTVDPISITNRKGLRIAIRIDGEPSGKLAFVAHGQGGFMGQVHIVAVADELVDAGYMVVRYDATHSIGESEGDIYDVTYDTYISDLEDVINWARSQPWYVEPFVLAGHSMGAQAIDWYAAHNSTKVSQLISLAPPVNFERYMQSDDKDKLEQWRKDGYHDFVSKSKPGVAKRIGWQVVESLKRYDLLTVAPEITARYLCVVGENDEVCSVQTQRLLLDSIASTDKQLVIIPNSDHNYRDSSSGEYEAHIDELRRAICDWL